MFTVPARSRRATAAPAMATDQLTPCGHPSRSSSCGSSRADTDRQRSGGDLRASCFSQVRLVPTYVAVSGGQTRREAGTLSHGTHEVSRVAEGEIPMINTTTTAPSGSAPMARTTSPWARLTTATWARARGPLGILEGTRWLFLGLALLSLALTVPVPLVEARGARVGVILVSSAVLVASWLVGYRRSRAPEHVRPGRNGPDEREHVEEATEHGAARRAVQRAEPQGCEEQAEDGAGHLA